MSISTISSATAQSLSLQSTAAASSTGSTSESTEYDEKDTNQDGVVSALEELQWSLANPGEDTEDQLNVLA